MKITAQQTIAMYRLAAIFTIFVVMGADINADLIAVDEIDLVNMIQPLQGDDYQCSKQGEIFCDTPTPPCEVGCMSIEKCWRLTCTGVCPGLDPKPFSGADLTSVCQSIVATLKVLKTGLIDFKDTTFYQKFTATTYLFVMGFDVCDDGRIVCDEVAGGCVDFDDACNDDGDCVCGLDYVVSALRMFLTPGNEIYYDGRRDLGETLGIYLF